MNTIQAVWLNLAMAVIFANLPFLRLVAFRRLQVVWADFFGWVVGYAAWMCASFVLEMVAGKLAAKGWEVWAITAALFAVLAFPGIVWRHLLQK
jgi:hypothetical protein